MERDDNNVTSRIVSSKPEDKQSLAPQVQEYCEKFSLNPKLSKYLSGPFRNEDTCTSSTSRTLVNIRVTSTIKASEDTLPESTTITVGTQEHAGQQNVVINTERSNNPQEVNAASAEEVVENVIEPLVAQISRPPLVGQDFYDTPQVGNETICPVSPASSVASNRKLEWDNGADIGYSNAENQKSLQKSLSLPVLSDLKTKKSRKSLFRSSPEGNTEKTEELKQLNFDNDSDLETKVSIPPYSSSSAENTRLTNRRYSSTSSSGGLQKEPSSDSKSSNESKEPENVLNFLKGKIGFPIAESTAYIETTDWDKKFEDLPPLEGSGLNKSNRNRNGNANREAKESKSSSFENLQLLPKASESLKKWHSHIDISMVDQVSRYKNLKILKLNVSKPIVVECTSRHACHTSEDKLIQTSLPRNTSVAVQTDFDFSNCKQLKPEGKQPEKQGVIYVFRSDSDEDQNVHSSGTQTVSDILSNRCNSFEYLYGEEYDQKFVHQKSDDSPLEEAVDEKVDKPVTSSSTAAGNLKRFPPKSNLTSITTESHKTASTTSQVTSKDSPLAQLLAAKQDDLENNLRLLKIVMKSKKYDDVTKKFYLKRIIQKILDTKMSIEESSGSSNSAPDLSKETSSTSPEELNLQENKPWVPAPRPSKKRFKQRHLETETFTDEILPAQPIVRIPSAESKFVPIVPNRKQHSSFTVTDGGTNLSADAAKPGGSGDSSNSTANELYEALQPFASKQVTPAISSNTNSSTDEKIKMNWRDTKTRSEELFEQKIQSGEGKWNIGGDHLVKFANKERKHQLCWINNEISHLGKLKKLLETKHEPTHKALHTMVQKPRVEDMKTAKKCTTVYIVTTEKSSGGESSSKRSSINEGGKFCACCARACKSPKCPAHNVRPYSAASSSLNYEIHKPVPTATTCKCTCPERENRMQRPLSACNQSRPSSPPPLPSMIGFGKNVISIGDKEINLDKARLVSNERFSTDSNTGQAHATIHRYTFEVEEMLDCRETARSAPASPRKVNERKLSCELVITTDTVNAISQRTSPLPCLPECNKKFCKCNDKVTQTSRSLENLRASSSSSEPSSSSSSSECGDSRTNLCHCCKRQNIRVPRKPNACTDSPRQILCHPCYNQSLKANNMGTRPYYMFPGHVCNCYNQAHANTVQEMRNTIEKLEDLEHKDNYCKCRCAEVRPSSDHCLNCNCKLRKKGIAYTLILEPEDLKHKHKKKQRQPSLQEIKIKIPSPRKHKKSKKFVVCDSQRTTDDESAKENVKMKLGGKKKGRKPTLQDYLCVNKPKFVTSAEERRQCLIDLAFMREQRCQKYKQLLALTNGIPFKDPSIDNENSKPKRVISPVEMRKMTERNYKKLPEVQQKLLDNREKQIRKGNKLLADIFNQKLRRQVLKGKHTIPPDASIIKLV